MKTRSTLLNLVHLLLSLAAIAGGLSLGVFGCASMMGDPITPEAHDFQERWSALAFFVGCPVGLLLTLFGIYQLIQWLRGPSDRTP